MKSMLTRRFFISWILAAVVMFSLSYLWHGVFLNDFSRLNYPKQVFFVIAIVVYLFISLGISLVFPSPRLDSFKKSPLQKGALIGGGFGMALYLITSKSVVIIKKLRLKITKINATCGLIRPSAIRIGNVNFVNFVPFNKALIAFISIHLLILC